MNPEVIKKRKVESKELDQIEVAPRAIYWKSLPIPNGVKQLGPNLHFLEISACCWSHDLKLIVTSGYDSKINIFDEETGEILFSLKDCHKTGKQETRIDSLAISHADKLLASCSSNGSIRLWEFEHLFELRSKLVLEKQKLAGRVEPYRQMSHDAAVYKVEFSYNDRHLFSCSSDSTTKIWDITENTLVRIIRLSGWIFTISIFCIKDVPRQQKQATEPLHFIELNETTKDEIANSLRKLIESGCSSENSSPHYHPSSPLRSSSAFIPSLMRDEAMTAQRKMLQRFPSNSDLNFLPTPPNDINLASPNSQSSFNSYFNHKENNRHTNNSLTNNQHNNNLTNYNQNNNLTHNNQNNNNLTNYNQNNNNLTHNNQNNNNLTNNNQNNNNLTNNNQNNNLINNNQNNNNYSPTNSQNSASTFHNTSFNTNTLTSTSNSQSETNDGVTNFSFTTAHDVFFSRDFTVVDLECVEPTPTPDFQTTEKIFAASSHTPPQIAIFLFDSTQVKVALQVSRETKSRIWGSCFSCDGSRVLVGTAAGKLKILDSLTLACLAAKQVHERGIRSCFFAARDTLTISCSIWDGVKILNASTFETLQSIPQTYNTRTVIGISRDPSTQHMAVGDFEANLRIFSVLDTYRDAKKILLLCARKYDLNSIWHENILPLGKKRF